MTDVQLLKQIQLALTEAEKEFFLDIDRLFAPDFPQQRKFIEDPAKLKLLSCTRRAGKSMTAALYMIIEALLNPGCNILAIGLTRESIKNILWKDCLRFLDKKYNLGAV